MRLTIVLKNRLRRLSKEKILVRLFLTYIERQVLSTSDHKIDVSMY